jgi:exosortase A-associated hydrolase 2
MALSAFSLSTRDDRQDRRFCLFHEPLGPPRAALVYLHPFAEEMNKSRRMAALQARALAAAGYAVLQIDLSGCGDSSGDFIEAHWAGWVEDALSAAQWLRERTDAPLWWWGLRSGTLLGVQAAARLDAPSNLLLWQPAVSGKLLLHQFLRLRAVRDMLDGSAPGAAAQLRAELGNGRAVDIAGYALAPALAEGLGAAELVPPPRPGRAIWVEIGNDNSSSAMLSARDQWATAGWDVGLHSLAGSPFWQTAEIETVPALIDLTTKEIQRRTVPV